MQFKTQSGKKKEQDEKEKNEKLNAFVGFFKKVGQIIDKDKQEDVKVP